MSDINKQSSLKQAQHKNKGNIVFITGAQEYGGGEVLLISILRYLKNEGVNFTLVRRAETGFSRSLRQEKFHEMDIELGTSFGKWRGLNIFTPSTYFQFKRFYKSISNIVLKTGACIIHVQNDFKEKAFASIVGKKLNIPVVWTELGMLHPWIKSIPFRYIYRYVINKYANSVICVSSAVKEDLVEIGVDAGKLKVILNGVLSREDMPDAKQIRASYGFKDDEIVVCTLARLYQKKGVQDLVRAISVVSSSIPSIRLMVVGEGPYREQLEGLVDKLSLRKNVVFTGFVEDAVATMSACDVFALATYEREGLPMTILEAMALGKPVIATDVGGIVECVSNNKNGFLVEQRNIEQLAKSMGSIAQNKELRDKMGAASKEIYLEGFTLEHMCEETYKILENVCLR